MMVHELYCFKNLTKCKKCGEVIEKKGLAEHEEEAHTNQSCTFCLKEFDQSKIASHESVCPEKPVMCTFCE